MDAAEEATEDAADAVLAPDVRADDWAAGDPAPEDVLDAADEAPAAWEPDAATVVSSTAAHTVTAHTAATIRTSFIVNPAFPACGRPGMPAAGTDPSALPVCRTGNTGFQKKYMRRHGRAIQKEGPR